jgi:hypothetical protein
MLLFLPRFILCYNWYFTIYKPLVVASAALSQTIIERAPIIFLKSAESTAGEIDVSITPNQGVLPYSSFNWRAGFSLNLTRVNQLLGQPRASYAT